MSAPDRPGPLTGTPTRHGAPYQDRWDRARRRTAAIRHGHRAVALMACSALFALLALLTLSSCSSGDDGPEAAPTSTAAATTTTGTGGPTTTSGSRPSSTTSLGSSTTVPPTTNPTPTTTTTTAAAAVSTAIRRVDFRNGFVFTVEGVGSFTVANGQADRGTFPNTDFASIIVGTPIYGDLDGDGAEEAAVRTEYNTGGTGRFSSVWIYRAGGDGATKVAESPTGDRGDGGVADVLVDGGVLVIDNFANPQGACCPTALERHRYRLAGTALQEVGPSALSALVDLQSAAVPVSFLAGTDRATLRGYLEYPMAASFEAGAGQRLTVAPRAGQPAAQLVLRQGGGADSPIVTQGSSIEVTLPASGTYRLEVSSTPAQLAGILLDLRIV